MKIPSKIYIRPSENHSFPQTQLDFIMVAHTKKKDNDFEYINLSSVWHDAKVEKQPQSVCGNNPVLVVGLRNGRISYRHLWADMEDCWKDLDLLTPPSKMVYDKVLWAYVRDLVPGAKGKGE